MNYYFLVEDSKSFMKILPEWLKFIDFGCTRVLDILHVTNNNYILQSGHGVTQLITQALFETINTITANPGKINTLVIILDAENETVESVRNSVIDKISESYNIDSLDFEIKIFVCNRCIESWLLGKKGLYPSVSETHPDSQCYSSFIKHFSEHYYHYNIEQNDPEHMDKPDDSQMTVAKYHFQYFHDLCLYNTLCNNGKKYTKSNPAIAKEESFLNGMLQRIEETNHINSFKEYISFLIEESTKR